MICGGTEGGGQGENYFLFLGRGLKGLKNGGLDTCVDCLSLGSLSLPLGGGSWTRRAVTANKRLNNTVLTIYISNRVLYMSVICTKTTSCYDELPLK